MLAAVEPPRPADPRDWCRNPIDRFILAALERVALAPSPEAAAHTLRRRLAFDLTGLPGAGALLGDGRFPPLSNAVAARPSGTEPKIKFYLFTAAAPGAPDELAATKRALTARLDALERDLRALVGV